MDDPELQALRSQRLAELQQQNPGSAPSEGGGGGGGGASQQQKQAAQQKAESAAREEEMRNAILCQVLDQNARARISNIAVAKPEKARQVEQMIVNMARYGQISGKLTDDQLKGLLDQVAERMSSQKSTTVKFDRRRAALDSDDDDF